MKIKTKNHTILISSLVAVGLAATALAIWYFAFRDPTKGYEPKYEQVEQSESVSRDETTKQPAAKTGNQLPPTSEQVPESNAGSISINDLDQSRGFVNVAVTVSSFEENRCVYMFTSEGARPVVRELGSCNNISIPEIEFEKIGTYRLTVTAYDHDSKIEATRDINIR